MHETILSGPQPCPSPARPRETVVFLPGLAAKRAHLPPLSDRVAHGRNSGFLVSVPPPAQDRL